MEEVGFNPVNEQDALKERPTFLTVLCVLSWIGSGIMLLLYFILFLVKDFISENRDEVLENNQSEEAEMFIDKYITDFSLVIVYPMLMIMLGIVGVVLMYRMKRLGYYIYSVAHFVLMVLSYAAYNEIGWGGVILTILFLGLYTPNLKHMD